MSAAWKVKREIKRLATQIFQLGQYLSGKPRRWAYDRKQRQSITVTEGQFSFSQDIAILLIYQPNTLLNSLFFELEHFNSKGIAPVVVANHPLSPQDRDRLAPFCLAILERPNVGYDFGGYRDGVLHILEKGLRPRNLFVLNDSMWFPLRKNCTFLDTATESNAEIFGAFYNTKNRSKHHHHLQSYFYRFSGELVSDARFETFWRRLGLYQSKRLVVRECEVKLAGHFAKMGYRVDALINPEKVAAAGLRLSVEELRDVVAYHASTTRRGQSIFGKFQDQPVDEDWQHNVREAITNSRFQYYFIDAHPLVFLKELKAPFVKKSREYHYYPQREAIISHGLHREFDPIVQTELTGWNDSGKAGPPENIDFPKL